MKQRIAQTIVLLVFLAGVVFMNAVAYFKINNQTGLEYGWTGVATLWIVSIGLTSLLFAIIWGFYTCGWFNNPPQPPKEDR